MTADQHEEMKERNRKATYREHLKPTAVDKTVNE